MMTELRSGSLGAWIAGIAAAALLAATASGQSNRRGMMVIDDGNERHALSYAQPDVDAVTSPYVTRTDLPVFVRYLTLSEAQESAVDRLIAKYLEDFQTLVREQHPEPESLDDDRRGPMVALAGPGTSRPEPGAEGGAAEGEATNENDGAGAPEDGMVDVRDILTQELKAEGVIKESMDELPVRPGIGIGISVDGDPDSDTPPTPSIDVNISFGGEDDRLDEALRAKLEAAAKRAVPRIAEVIREQAAGEMAMRLAGGEGRSPADEIAQRWDELEALREGVRAFKNEADALLERLFASIRRLLSETQIEQWPTFDRALLRIKTLPWGELDGESTDLIAITEVLDLSSAQTAQFQEELAAYEMRLDAALKRRNDLLDTADAVIDRAMYLREFDQATAMAQRLATARVAVRNLNDLSIETLAGSLEEWDGQLLKRAALAEAYPRIYRPTIGQTAFDQAITMDSLDDDVRFGAIELAQQYMLRINDVNERLHRSVRREQEDGLVLGIHRAVATLQNREGGMTEPGEESMIAAAFQERRDLDAQYMKLLYGLLPAEAVASLPALPQHRVGEEVAAEHRDWSEATEPN